MDYCQLRVSNNVMNIGVCVFFWSILRRLSHFFPDKSDDSEERGKRIVCDALQN